MALELDRTTAGTFGFAAASFVLNGVFVLNDYAILFHGNDRRLRVSARRRLGVTSAIWRLYSSS